MNTKPTATFVDYKAGHARAHADELDPAKDAVLFAEPPPVIVGEKDLPRLRRQIAEVHNATAHGFACIGLPVKFRWLVCVIIAAAAVAEQEAAAEGRAVFDGDVTTFRASYKTLVELMYRHGDGRTFEAKKQEVARLLRAFKQWQERADGVTLCTVRPGGKTEGEKGVEYHETEFDVIFLDAVAKAMARDPRPDRMRAAVRVEVAAMMKLPPFDARWQKKKPDLKEMQKRDRNAAIFKATKAALAESTMGGDPAAFVEDLARVMMEAARLVPEKLAEIRRRSPQLTPDEARDLAIRAAIEEAQAAAQDRIEVADPPAPPDTPPPAPDGAALSVVPHAQTSSRDEVSAGANVGNTAVEFAGGVTDASHPPAPASGGGTATPGMEIAPKEKPYKVSNPDEVPPSEPAPPEVVEYWSEVERRMRAPRVQLTTVELRAGQGAGLPDAADHAPSAPPLGEAEFRQLIVEMVESGALDEVQAGEFEACAGDAGVRARFWERYGPRRE